MRGFGVLSGVLVFCAAPMLAQTDDNAPLSAIDWLSESVEQPEIAVAAPDLGTQATRIPDPDEDPVANSATTPSVSVQTLGGPAPRALGLLSPEITGFPSDIWQNSEAATLAALMLAQQVDTLPAVQDLITSLALTQANPPRVANVAGAFFQARIDKLLDFGALDAAQAMLEAASPDSPELFRRWFDVSLLTGTEDAACRELQDRPDVAPTPSARIFCLARSGDWSAAALTLNTGLALGDIDADTGALLARFLDPDLFEGDPALAPPARVTPLTFRMFEAIGSPLTTQGLPRAFAQADLRENVGWKAQLEAAERLARAGSIPDNALVGLYSDKVPAASGGVWERAKAVGRLQAALAGDDESALETAVETLWDEALELGVLPAVAEHFAPQLLIADAGDAADILFKLLLLSSAYEAAALDEALAQTAPFMAALARGEPAEVTTDRAGYDLIRSAFAAQADADLLAMAEEGRTGEAILRTIATLQQGIDGDEMAFRDGIATLRALGLEDVARRTSLQYLLLR